MEPLICMLIRSDHSTSYTQYSRQYCMYFWAPFVSTALFAFAVRVPLSGALFTTALHSSPLFYCWWALSSWIAIARAASCATCGHIPECRCWATSTSHSRAFQPLSLSSHFPLLVLLDQTMSMCSSSVFLARPSRVTNSTRSLCFWWNYSESTALISLDTAVQNFPICSEILLVSILHVIVAKFCMYPLILLLLILSNQLFDIACDDSKILRSSLILFPVSSEVHYTSFLECVHWFECFLERKNL